jgi:hypothetical protein
VRRYSAHGTGHFINANDFVGEGNATHLGNYSEVGNVSFTPVGTVLHIEGWVVYTATIGDELRAVFEGELDPATGVVTATVTYVPGGTGRFLNVSGSSNLQGLVDGPNISVTVRGNIDF